MSTKFKCDICQKEFSTKSSLATHQKTAKFCLAKKSEPVPGPSPDEVVPSHSSQSSQAVQSDPYDSFINELKRHYENTISDKIDRIITLENLVEKMELKLERYQNTIMAIALNSLRSSYVTTTSTTSSCNDPSCMCNQENQEQENQEQENHE
jgi:hypothetical protein